MLIEAHDTYITFMTRNKLSTSPTSSSCLDYGDANLAAASSPGLTLSPCWNRSVHRLTLNCSKQLMLNNAS